MATDIIVKIKQRGKIVSVLVACETMEALSVD
jgi:hypothetical protein